MNPYNNNFQVHQSHYHDGNTRICGKMHAQYEYMICPVLIYLNANIASCFEAKQKPTANIHKWQIYIASQCTYIYGWWPGEHWFPCVRLPLNQSKTRERAIKANCTPWRIDRPMHIVRSKGRTNRDSWIYDVGIYKPQRAHFFIQYLCTS